MLCGILLETISTNVMDKRGLATFESAISQNLRYLNLYLSPIDDYGLDCKSILKIHEALHINIHVGVDFGWFSSSGCGQNINFQILDQTHRLWYVAYEWKLDMITYIVHNISDRHYS